MSTESVVAILGALGAFLASTGLLYRQLTGEKFKRRVDESARILSGYTDTINTLNDQLTAAQTRHAAEMEALIARHRAEMEALNRLHSQERDRWQVERDRLEDRIEQCEAQVTALIHRPLK